jgi:DNA-directed RNA polymerase specialized sigma24 family protein
MLNMLHACHVVSDEDFSLLAKLHVYGSSYRELVEEYREPLGTLSSRITRARLALKNAVKKLDQEGGG